MMNDRTGSGTRGVKYVRIRKRGLLFAVMITLVILGIFLIFGTGGKKGTLNSSVEADTVQQKYYTSVEIHPGDTLWSLAENYGRRYHDYSEFIEEVRSINQLSDDRIRAGAYLFIPVYR